MKIALLGYGKMGKEIEKLALQKNHEIVFIVDENNADDISIVDSLRKADVAIEFSIPEAAYNNILKCFEANIPVVVGTTGWLDRLSTIKEICAKKQQALFYSSNYSIGVNIFFLVNKKLAELMNNQIQYEVSIEEIHHTQKLDAPSGTAISLASDIIEKIERKEKWTSVLQDEIMDAKPGQLPIKSLRIENVPGTHLIKYNSEIDSIELKHTAHSRKGFAQGALLAAEWIRGKKGVFNMQDLLNF